jgi:DNA replication protein DnaC
MSGCRKRRPTAFSHADFLELILQDELNVRQERLLKRRTASADFRHLKTLEDFDWTFNQSVKSKDIYNWPPATSSASAPMSFL